MKKIWIILAALLLVSGCGNAPAEENNGQLKVYTSFYAMYDFTKTIAGEYADVENLVPIGVEPHDWEPTPEDMIKLEKADVFVYSGKGMESWCGKVLASLSNKAMTVVEAARGVTELAVEGDVDPHVWLDPENAVAQLEVITEALARKDPVNAENYRKNFAEQKEKLIALDQEFDAALTACPKKEIIVSHKAYGYLCNAYGLKQIAAEGLAADSDASPAQLAQIVQTMQEKNIHYIFFEELIKSKAMETIQRETGAEALILDPFEGDRENSSYLTVMKKNLLNLKTALE